MSTQAIIRHRRDTAANWTSNDPVLEDGQLGYETDTGKWKWGDGATAWTALAYAPASEAAIASLTDSTGGTPDGTLDAISGSGADAGINKNFAELHAKLDAVLVALRAYGVIAP